MMELKKNLKEVELICKLLLDLFRSIVTGVTTDFHCVA